jgi:uncharacterized protein (TIGR03083 family)
MDYDAHLAAVRREIDAFDEALRAGPLDAAVPSCPEWTVADLAGHVGYFMGFWTHVLCDGTGRARPPVPVAPDASGLLDWWAGRAEHLVAELETTPPDTTVWTWVEEDKTARFPARRAANELAVHRVDAELARSHQQPVEPGLAEDGIDEIFLMIANRASAPEGSGETLHLHATDRQAEWLLTFEPDRIDVRREHAKGDAAVRASVSDLEMLLYQRPTLGPVERFGDEAVLARFHRTFQF